MSLCDLIIQPTAGFLMSDAGAWDASGRLVGLRPKTAIFPKAHAAVVMRGAGLASESWAAIAREIGPIDELLEYLPRLAADLTANGVLPGEARNPWAEVTVLYWDKGAARPRAKQLHTAPIGQTDGVGYAAILDAKGRYQPGQWFEPPSLCLTPTLVWDAPLPDLRDQMNEARFDVRKSAPDIVNAQRATKTDFAGNAVSTVAGWVDMAVVTRAGVTMERVTSWPDQVSSARPRKGTVPKGG